MPVTGDVLVAEKRQIGAKGDFFEQLSHWENLKTVPPGTVALLETRDT